ncbi:MAG: M20/M25/M40 family metallo-hydrolase [Dehalococcoidia bacterium]|nr:M20/M25/M40 family metallo-hydrolase [Dehalococcoidia bacterium]
MTEELRAAVERVFPSVRADLEGLVRIPSVSADPEREATLRECAERVRALLEGCGLGAELLEVPGAPPVVLASRGAPEGAPTVLLYAHYDVQPAGDLGGWSGDPFEPVEQAGRLHGRGASDDKSGIATHLGALRAIAETGEDLGVGVTVVVEGEEELGSPHADALLERYGERLRADAIVIADSEHWAVGHPAMTTSLRGLVDAVVEVRTLEAGVHSGQFGGAVPDAISALARLIATLHDERGNCAIEGLMQAAPPEVDVEEAELRRSAGMLDGVEVVGDASIAARLWMRPAVSVLALDAPRLSEAINQIVPVARAKVSLRLAPGEDPARAMDALVRHLEGHAPWGARVTVTRGSTAPPFALMERGDAFRAFADGMAEAWGRPPAEIGVGGSIPLVAMLAERFPEAAILITGVGDPTSRIHGPDESQDLGELQRSILAEALALQQLGRS